MPDWIENKYKGNLGYIPNIPLDGTVEWSMEELFESPPPYNTKMFLKLCPRTKWFGRCIEGDAFCTSCGTQTPSVPRSHHPTCYNYQELDEYLTVEETWWLGVCPSCKVDDYVTLSIDSCRELGISQITCSECDFIYQDECCEEDLENFLKEK